MYIDNRDSFPYYNVSYPVDIRVRFISLWFNKPFKPGVKLSVTPRNVAFCSLPYMHYIHNLTLAMRTMFALEGGITLYAGI